MHDQTHPHIPPILIARNSLKTVSFFHPFSHKKSNFFCVRLEWGEGQLCSHAIASLCSPLHCTCVKSRRKTLSNIDICPTKRLLVLRLTPDHQSRNLEWNLKEFIISAFNQLVGLAVQNNSTYFWQFLVSFRFFLLCFFYISIKKWSFFYKFSFYLKKWLFNNQWI